MTFSQRFSPTAAGLHEEADGVLHLLVLQAQADVPDEHLEDRLDEQRLVREVRRLQDLAPIRES